MSHAPRSAYIAWILVCLLWGTTYLAIRVTLETMPPLLMAGMRWFVAGSLILPALVAAGVQIPAPRQWPALAVLGILLMGLGNGCVAWAEQTIPSGLTAVLVAAVPFWMVGVERLFAARAPGAHAEHVSPRRLAGLMIGFAGIVMLVWPELRPRAGRSFVLGIVATQVACLGWAIGSSYARRRHVAENVLAASALQMLFGGLALLAAGAAAGEWQQLAFNARTTGALIYLIAAGSLGGYTAYAYALKYLPVATVSMYAYVNPVIAVFLGTLVLGEPFHPRLAAAGAVVLTGMVFVRES
jgi:drug/metabolite transporter (DMT)-like permease